MIERLLTPKDVSAILQVSRKFLDSLIARGEIPYIRLPGIKRGSVRFCEEDIQAFIAKNRIVYADPIGTRRVSLRKRADLLAENFSSGYSRRKSEREKNKEGTFGPPKPPYKRPGRRY